ncbi:TPA: hypothetical protein ACKP22_000283 [Pseudomonas putida]
MTAPNTSTQAYPYGPDSLMMWVAMVAFGACAAVCGYLHEDGDLKSSLVILCTVLLTIFMLGNVVYFALNKRQIVLTPDSLQIPEKSYSSKIVELRYADLVHVEYVKGNTEDVLLISHRGGDLKVPIPMLDKVGVEWLQRTLLTRRDAHAHAAPRVPVSTHPDQVTPSF